MEKKLQDLEKNFTQVTKTQRELQKEVEGLKFPLEKALNSLMPKIDSLLSDRTGTETNVSTGSSSVNLKSIEAPSTATSKAKEDKYIPANSSAPTVSASSVFEAAEIGDMETLLSHLKSRTSANQRNEKWFTLLQLAVSGGHEKAVKALLDAGAVVNARGPLFTTSLHLAVEKGFVNIVDMLLVAGADINAPDNCHITPLLLAVKTRHSHLVKLLMEKGASLNAADIEGNSALLLAVKKGDTGWVKFLIEKGASLHECDNGNKTALWYAVDRGANDLIKLLCDKGASVKIGDCPLSLAARNGNTEAVMLLLQYMDRESSICDALSQVKDVSVVWAFEDARPGLMTLYDAECAMTTAAEFGRVHSLKALLDAGVNVNVKLIYECGSALSLAKKCNKTECVKLLLERGAKE